MCVPVPLSVPHNPSMYDERMRIQKQGGHVKYALDVYIGVFLYKNGFLSWYI